MLAQYLKNTYSSPAKLVLSDGRHILSQEGTTQGDNLASAFYGLSSKPVIDELKKVPNTAQAWWADDAAAGGKIIHIKKWWDKLCEIGPLYGYYPKPSKTMIIVKRAEDLEEVKKVFSSAGIKISLNGERHLGAVLGSETFKHEYVKEKIDKCKIEFNKRGAL